MQPSAIRVLASDNDCVDTAVMVTPFTHGEFSIAIVLWGLSGPGGRAGSMLHPSRRRERNPLV